MRRGAGLFALGFVCGALAVVALLRYELGKLEL